MTLDRMAMSDKHEQHVARVLHGRQSKASGSQWTDQADGRNEEGEPFAFAWDCKSTLGKSHTVTLEMIAKLRDQAQSERPMFPLRWYSTEKLDVAEDWALVRLDDLAELTEVAREHLSVAELEQEIAKLNAELIGMAHRAKLADDRVRDLGEELMRAHAQAQQSAFMPSPVTPSPQNLSPLIPRLPWMSVFVTSIEGVQRRSARAWDQDGHERDFQVTSVRVEPYGQGKRLFVDEQIVRHGDLWIDGQLDTRVGA